MTSRAWIFNPSTHPDWNVAAGGGLKLPTGNEAYKDTFVDVRGAVQGILGNPVPGFVRSEIEKYVDQSVQPGDGGWGIMTDVQAFWCVKKVLLFGSGSYLVNPQDTNDAVDPDGAGHQHDEGAQRRIGRQLDSRPVPASRRPRRRRSAFPR